jgi:hypothetical protein
MRNRSQRLSNDRIQDTTPCSQIPVTMEKRGEQDKKKEKIHRRRFHSLFNPPRLFRYHVTRTRLAVDLTLSEAVAFC